MESKPVSASTGKTDMIRMTDQEFHSLTTYIKQHYGIDLTKKRVLIESRISACPPGRAASISAR